MILFDWLNISAEEGSGGGKVLQRTKGFLRKYSADCPDVVDEVYA